MLKNLDLSGLSDDLNSIEALSYLKDLQAYAGKDTDIRQVHFNKPQLKAQIVGANEGYHVWGRGTGKSEGLISEWAARCAHAMPRSRGAFIARTYLQLLERTLPPVIKGWENQGYRRGKDFWVRERPPKNANVPLPIVGPCNSEHSIFWKNGSVISMVSQDRPGSANSMTIHYEGGDEAKFLDKGKLDTEVAPANRGDGRYFEGIAEFHSIMYCTDMPTDPAAQWILDKQGEMNEHKIDLILAIQLEIHEKLLPKLLTTPPHRRGTILAEIQRRKKQYNQLRASAIHYTEASTLDNIEAFGIKNYLRLKRSLPSFIFSTAILNRRRKGGGLDFYPDLGAHNYYDAIDYSHIDKYDIGASRPDDCRKDTDLDDRLPLLAGLDYNSRINPIALGQLHGRRLQVVKDLHVLSPMKIKDLAIKMDKYYKPWKRKWIIAFYDHTALPTSATSDVPYIDHFVDELRHRGWDVEDYYIGITDDYENRYENAGIALRGGNADIPFVTFNRTNTEYLCEAMRQAKTEQGYKGFRKNKLRERDEEEDQRETTHYTDAFDTLLEGAIQYMKDGTGRGKSMDIIST